MFPLKDMKEYAKKVDEGITSLEIRLQEPSKILSSMTEESAHVANVAINSTINGLKSIKKGADGVIRVESENLEESKNTTKEAEDVLSGIVDEINGMEEYLIQFGIQPFSKVLFNNSDSESPIGQHLSNAKKEYLNSDESLNFTTPNYSSTPDSLLCGNSKEKPEFLSEPRFMLTKKQLLNDTTNKTMSSDCSSPIDNINACSSSKVFNLPSISKEIYNRSPFQNYSLVQTKSKFTSKNKNY